MLAKFNVIMSKKVFFVIGGIQLASVVAAVFMFVFGKKVCMTDKCMVLSQFLKAGMMNTVNPCDDFYSFACGATPTPLGMQISVEISNIVWFLKTLSKPPEKDDWKVFKLIKNFYQKCTKRMPKEEIVKRLSVLFKELGGFPSVDGAGWDEAAWSWQDAVSRATREGFWATYFFTLFLVQSPQDPSKIVFSVNLPDLPSQKMPITQLFNLLAMFAPSANESNKQGAEMTDVEDALLILMAKHSTMNQTNMMTLSDVTASFGFVNWTNLIEIVSQSQEDLSDDLEILVAYPGYLSDLKILLKKLPNRMLADYMMWCNLSQLMSYLKDSSENLVCYNFLKETMSTALQAMYLNKRPYTPYKDSVTDMTLKIKRELIKSVEKSNWMDFKTKREALNKVEMMKTRIGYPEEFLNRTYIDERYMKLSLDGDLLNTILMFKKRFMEECYNQRLTFKNTFADILLYSSLKIYSPNAFNIFGDNSIILLHSVLVPPFYHREWPSYVNYGLLGSVVGHEFTHGLDTMGCHYDAEGRIRNWWENQTFAEFTEKAQCFVEQFNNFSFFNISLPGTQEVGENIADSGGVELAFHAYQRLPKGWFGQEPALPNFELTQEQTFFMSFSQFFCRRYQSEDVLREDGHAPNNARVLGTLQNTRHFSDAFGCDYGTKMNPKHKCKLW